MNNENKTKENKEKFKIICPKCGSTDCWVRTDITGWTPEVTVTIECCNWGECGYEEEV